MCLKTFSIHGEDFHYFHMARISNIFNAHAEYLQFSREKVLKLKTGFVHTRALPHTYIHTVALRTLFDIKIQCAFLSCECSLCSVRLEFQSFILGMGASVKIVNGLSVGWGGRGDIMPSAELFK